MDKRDQVAIHEAMEQQTISVTKAGIQATLNARTSILAAANPVFGRYDKSKALRYNLDISAAIMSRFDLFFVVLDECNELADDRIARYIVNLHQKQERAIEAPYSTSQLQKYIRYARTIKPVFTREAAAELQQAYIRLRVNDATSQKTAYRITVRQLESLVRLSEALARVHLSKQILPQFVREAARLLSNSILKIEKPDLVFAEEALLQQQLQPSDHQATGGNIIRDEIQNRMEEEKRKQKFKLTYEEYLKFSKMLISYFRKCENELQAASENMTAEQIGVLKSGAEQQKAVEWFVEQNLDKIESEQDAQKIGRIGHSVINRMINQERVLIVVEDCADWRLRKLTLHSNYVTDI